MQENKKNKEYEKELAAINLYIESLSEIKDGKAELLRFAFAKRLKRIRESKNLTQKEMARRLFITTGAYANWEQARREPKIYDIWNILIELEIDANELFNNLLEELK